MCSSDLVREGIRGAMLTANPIILEPIQVMMFEAPIDYMGAISKLISSKRGQLLNIEQTDAEFEARAKMPVAEMIGMSNDLRSSTEGRGVSSLVAQTFERLPSELQDKIVKSIRQRKGLKVEQSE